MKLVKLSYIEYTTYAKDNNGLFYKNTEEYAHFLNNLGYSYDILGLKDNLNTIKAASFIYYKDKYGYIPGGFLIDYHDQLLVKEFIKALKKQYTNLIYIKIEPNIIIGTYNKDNNNFDINNEYINILNSLGFKKITTNDVVDNHPLINLKTFYYNTLNKNTKNKVRKSYKKGLKIKKGTFDNLKDIYPFIEKKYNKPYKHYEYLVNNMNNMLDIFEIEVDFQEYLINAQADYEKELVKNNNLVKKTMKDPTLKTLQRKMHSDSLLLELKQNIIKATNGLKEGRKKIIAGALVIKYNNTAIIIDSGFDNKYKNTNVNYFLYYKLIEYYKYNYKYLDMDGFSYNKYHGLNEFKLGFNPDIYSLIGTYDIILKPLLYKNINHSKYF